MSDVNLANWADALAQLGVVLLEAGVALEMEARMQSVHQLSGRALAVSQPPVFHADHATGLLDQLVQQIAGSR